MTKIRKQKRKKVYRTNVNRKRLNRKQKNVGKIACKPIDKAWDEKKTIRKNLKQMGLMYDPNASIKRSNVKQKIKKQILTSMKGDAWHEEVVEQAVLTKPEKQKKPKVKPPKIHVAEELEREARAPRERNFRLPKGQVEFITYLLDKYGHDYKAMARDRRNHYQETWKQIRAKVKTFMGIPEQYSEYLQSRGLLNQDAEDAKIAAALAMDDDSD
ncbi:nucleolar protein 16 [Chrysoperla carnea]|uniref:nucleolar protein 16 n=1 Tax=Chrysoperla carnea TaxID=189513 RepID=UPI001D09723C|nr:nucleolar protein 16 [Chrysoperla carnea]